MTITEEIWKLKGDIPIEEIANPLGSGIWQVHCFYQSYVLKLFNNLNPKTMSKITAEEMLLKHNMHSLEIMNNIFTPDGNKGSQGERLINAMQEHTKQNIEALRDILLIQFYGLDKEQDLIDKLFNQFLENIK